LQSICPAASITFGHIGNPRRRERRGEEFYPAHPRGPARATREGASVGEIIAMVFERGMFIRTPSKRMVSTPYLKHRASPQEIHRLPIGGDLGAAPFKEALYGAA